MQFQYRYQTLNWPCISINIEILFHALQCIILHLLILQLYQKSLYKDIIRSTTMNLIQPPYKSNEIS